MTESKGKRFKITNGQTHINSTKGHDAGKLKPLPFPLQKLIAAEHSLYGLLCWTKESGRPINGLFSPGDDPHKPTGVPPPPTQGRERPRRAREPRPSGNGLDEHRRRPLAMGIFQVSLDTQTRLNYHPGDVQLPQGDDSSLSPSFRY